MIRQILKKKFTSTFHSRFYNKEIKNESLPPLSETTNNNVLTNVPSLNNEILKETKVDTLLEPIYNDTENISIFTTIFNYISPTQLFEFILTQFHEVSGIPWYLTISLTALAFKTLLVPIVVKTTKNAAKLQEMQPGNLLLLSKTLHQVTNFYLTCHRVDFIKSKNKRI
jgi:membrane protein insertase Oxa1/YidC/SpoIIIJ